MLFHIPPTYAQESVLFETTQELKSEIAELRKRVEELEKMAAMASITLPKDFVYSAHQWPSDPFNAETLTTLHKRESE